MRVQLPFSVLEGIPKIRRRGSNRTLTPGEHAAK